ncbi:hypothetical protein [Streptomyces alfalfae]|nr:hypothetical protein [Streptomyces alfalfae]
MTGSSPDREDPHDLDGGEGAEVKIELGPLLLFAVALIALIASRS